MYKNKYLKYKNKYLELKNLLGGGINIPLELLLNNPAFDFLFEGYKHIDKSLITNITYERIITKITYEKYNPETNSYSLFETDERSNQLLFKISVNYSPEPIIICCEDSRLRDWAQSHTYRFIHALSTKSDNGIIWKFVKNGSMNYYQYCLEKLGQVLGHIVNNNILLLEEKILNHNECPINLTPYDSSDNVILLFPCLHSISNAAYSTGLVRECPICRSRIDSIQSLTIDEFNRLFKTL